MLTPKEMSTPMAEEEDEEDISAATLSKIIELLGKTYGFEVEAAVAHLTPKGLLPKEDCAEDYKSHYATTIINQGDIEFKNTWDFGLGDKTDKNAIIHLTAIFEEKDSLEASGEDGFDDEAEINFYGMTPKEFATFLVEHDEKAKELYNTEWRIYVHHEIDDPENWEHPCKY